MNKSLYASEWVLVGSLLAILCSLVFIAHVNARRASYVVGTLKTEEIVVSIEGAVAKPGNYKIEVGTPIGEALRKARPKKEADLSAFALKDPVLSPCRLTVEEMKEITVKVQGAVAEEKWVKVPAKSRICDLKKKISLSGDADKAFFRRKKRLKEGDIIEVPKKTVE